MPPTSQPNTEPQAIIGFLAQVIISYPQEKEHILNQHVFLPGKNIYFSALYRAGLPQDAKKYALLNGASEEIKKYPDNAMPVLQKVQPFAYPGDNDLLIGAYMASGDTRYIEKILNNYKSADDKMASNAFRMALMNSKFGPSLSPQGRDKTMIKAMCEKYQCKTNPQNFMRLGTLSSAFWALQSLALKDEGIKKTVSDFFQKNSHLKQLLDLEQNAFYNYLTMVTAYSAIKDNPNINSSLLVYEQLGSAEDALKAMTQKN